MNQQLPMRGCEVAEPKLDPRDGGRICEILTASGKVEGRGYVHVF